LINTRGLSLQTTQKYLNSHFKTLLLDPFVKGPREGSFTVIRNDPGSNNIVYISLVFIYL